MNHMLWNRDEDLPSFDHILEEINEAFRKDIKPVSLLIRSHLRKERPTFYEQREFEYELTQFYQKYIARK